MNPKISKLINNLVILSVLYFPLTYYGEILAIFNNQFNSMGVIYTPFFLKFSKDLLLIIIILLTFLLNIFYFNKLVNNRIKLYFLSIIFAVLILACFQDNIYLSLIGIRWMLPIIFMTLMINLVEDKSIESISSFLYFFLIFNFIVQIFQVFFSTPFFGYNTFGWARSPGLFGNINTSSFFICLTIHYLTYFNFSYKKIRLSYLIGFLSIIICSSGTGFVVYLFLLSIFAYHKLFKFNSLFFISLILFFSIFPIFYFLGEITGRGDDLVLISGLTRFNIFYEAILDFELFSSKFGVATNTANLFIDNFDGINNVKTLVVDSFFSSLLINLGLLLFVCFLIGLFLPILYININKFEKISFVIICLGFFSTSIYTEIYPINILIGFLFAYYYSNDKFKNKKCVY